MYPSYLYLTGCNAAKLDFHRYSAFYDTGAVLWIMIKVPKQPTLVAGQLWILPFLEILNLEIKQKETKYKVSVKPEDCGPDIGTL